AEHWDNAQSIKAWVNVTNFSNHNPVDAFDFPLRELLKAVCDQYGFSLTNLASLETVLSMDPETTVTFVENHDLRDEGRPILNDKLLAYSFVLTHQGYPCVFWKDYYNEGLAHAGTPNGIDALVETHELYAGGGAHVLWVDDALYIMERSGHGDKPGLIYVLNNRGDRWQGASVTTHWRDTELVPVAWWSSTDMSRPDAQYVHADGSGQFWAPPRG